MRRLLSCSSLCVFISLACVMVSASAQIALTSVGRPGRAGVIPVEHGFIDPATGNLHLEIPLESYKQRGEVSDTLRLVYDSSIWTNTNGSWQPTNVPNSYGGWSIRTARDQPFISFDTFDGNTDCGTNSYYYGIHAAIWQDVYGTTHYFPIQTVQVPAGCNAPSPYTDTPSGSAYAADGSGYYAQVTNYNQVVIYDPAGTEVASTAPSGLQYPLALDRNGNYLGLATDAAGSSSDTLERTLFTYSSGGTNTWYYDVLSYGGVTARYTITTQNIPLNTSFGFGGPEFTGNVTVIARIDLPDGTYYNFSYDGAYGELIAMNLPQSGAVEFGYRTDTQPTHPPRYVGSHDGSDGHTNFAYVTGVMIHGAGGTVPALPVSSSGYVMNKGDGKTVVYAYNSSSNYIHPSYIGYYNGPVNYSIMNENRVSADYFTYDTSNTCPSYLGTDISVCHGYMWANPVEVKRIDDSSGKIKTTQYAYSNTGSGVPSDIKMWDYYPNTGDPQGYGVPGEPSGTPARETAQIQGQTVNGKPLITDEKVYGAGALASWTTFGYDEAGHETGVSNAPQLAWVAGTRGNQTSITRHYLEDGHTAATNFYYDDAGVLTSQTDALGNSTSYGHDATDAFVTKVTYPNPNVADYTQSDYDPSTGVLNHTWDDNQAKTTYGYDSIGRLTNITRPDQGATTITYPNPLETDISRTVNGQVLQSSVYKDTFGRTVRKTIGSGSSLISTEIGYDGYGRLYSISNPHTPTTPSTTDGTTFYTYDQFDRILTVQKADGNSVTASYSANTILVTDENNHQKQLSYDAFGDLIAVTEQNDSLSLGWVTSYVYDKLGLLYQISQLGSDATQPRTSTFINDSFGRMTSQSMPESGTKTLIHDDNDNLTSIADSANRTVSYTYDSLNRITQKQLSAGPTYTYSYDGHDSSGDSYGIGRLTSYSNGTNLATYLLHDNQGHVYHESFCLPSDCSQPYQVTIAASYDQADNLTSLLYPDGLGVNYSYDNLNRLASVDTFLGKSGPGPVLASNFQYAPVGLLTQLTLGNGVQTNASFGPRLNITGLSYTSPQGTMLYSKSLVWDPTGGNLSTYTDNVHSDKTTTYTYDQVNRLTSAVATGNTGSPSSTAASSVTLTVAGADSTSTQQICSNGTSCVTQTTWDSGTVTLLTNQHSNSVSYPQGSTGVSVAAALASVINNDCYSPLTASASSNVITLTLKSGAVGTYNLSVQSQSANPSLFPVGSFSDTLSASAIGNAAAWSNYALTENYSYDSWGNLQQSGNFSFLQSYTANNQISSGDYQYDPATGNLLSDTTAGVTNNYKYDSEGMLIGSNGANYLRDPFGRRVSRTSDSTTEYIYFGGQLVATRDPANGVWTDRISANGRYIAKVSGPWEAPVPVYRLGNYLDSTALLTDASGSIIGGAEFTPFGQTISSSGPEAVGFTGDDVDSENSSYHTIFRNFSPQQGRWLSPDPYLGSIDLTDPQSLNRYAYVRNRPTLATDRFGLDGGDDDDDDDGDSGDQSGGQNAASEHPFPSYAPPAIGEMDTGTVNGNLLNLTLSFNGSDALIATANSNGSNISDGIAVGVMTAGSFVPGPIGAAFGLGLAIHSAFKGNYGSAGLFLGGAALQFFGLPGEELAQAGVHIAEALPAAEAAEEMGEGITLFRGVSSSHPGYENALNGVANPWGGDAGIVDHALGNTRSAFTSWTSDYEVAQKYATLGSDSGVILTKTFQPGSGIPLPGNMENFLMDSEYLIRGPVSGASVTPVP
jgi:RHS repeat-associated protein